MVVDGSCSDKAVLALITLHLGPKNIMLALNIEFKDYLSSDEIEGAVRRIEQKIRESHAEVKRIFDLSCLGGLSRSCLRMRLCVNL